jgi:hypothetical protein
MAGIGFVRRHPTYAAHFDKGDVGGWAEWAHFWTTPNRVGGSDFRGNPVDTGKPLP